MPVLQPLNAAINSHYRSSHLATAKSSTGVRRVGAEPQPDEDADGKAVESVSIKDRKVDFRCMGTGPSQRYGQVI